MCVCVFQIAADVRTAKRDLKKARTVLQMDQLKCRKRVLRRLGFASPSDVIEMKGRVACEISRWEKNNTDSLLFYTVMYRLAGRHMGSRVSSTASWVSAVGEVIFRLCK